MVRRICVCGNDLYGLGNHGPLMFGFVPSSSLAHVNYDCAFDDAVCLSGGRVMEQCESCGALILCDYPTLDGSHRGEDPMITYGPGTVYEECEVESVPTIYRSFRALMASGVTGGVMYSDAFRDRIAQLFNTDIDRIPSWKVVKDAMQDRANVAFDEWWAASIGRNFIVLYENTNVLRPVAAWHRVPGTEILNRDFAFVNNKNDDPLKNIGSDTAEVADSNQRLIVPDERARILRLGDSARLNLIEQSIPLCRTLLDLPTWAPQEVITRGMTLYNNHSVRQLHDTRFGIWSGFVREDGQEYQVDMLLRHDIVAKIMCTCDAARHNHVCVHMVCIALQMAERFRFRIPLVQDLAGSIAKRSSQVAQAQPIHSEERFEHYADAIALFHKHADVGERYRWITSFIEPIEGAQEPLYHIEFMDNQGPMRTGYCVYHKVLLNFIDAVISKSNHEYIDVLHRYGLEKDVAIQVLNPDAMDGALVEALVTMIIYKERRNEGFLAECVENGSLIRLLRRLRAIDYEQLEQQSTQE